MLSTVLSHGQAGLAAALLHLPHHGHHGSTQLVEQNHRPAQERKRSLIERDAGPDWVGNVAPPSHGEHQGARLFPGINQTGWTPPDDNLAVSGTEVVEAVNEQLAFFDKTTGSSLYGGANLSLPTLFPSALGNSVFDPRIVYDQATGHFLLSALEQSSRSKTSILDIAVSADSTPSNDPATWHTYRFNVTQTLSRKSAAWMDFDGLGFDGTAVYVTGNMFSFNTGTFQDVKLVTFDKAAMESGAPVTAASNTKIIADGSFSYQPAVNLDGTSSNVLVAALNATTLELQTVQNPLSGPSSFSVASSTVAVPSFGTSVPNAPQSGTTSLINTGDARTLNAVLRNGSLWTAHTINSGGKAVARWYQIDPVGHTVTNSGNIDLGNDASGKPISTFYPSIAVDANGTMAIGYSESSAGMFPTAAWTRRAADGTLSSGVIHLGDSFYTGTRWGDYSGTVADPSLAGVFWAVGETASSSSQWATWWAQI